MAFFKRKRSDETELPSAPVEEKPASPSYPADGEKDNGGRFFGKLRDGLSKTRNAFTGRMDRLFLGKKEITEDLLDELEEILFTSDIGVTTTQELIDSVQEKVARKELKDPDKLKTALRDQMLGYLKAAPVEQSLPKAGEPFVVMVAGVNGVGKTTTVGKAAHRFKSEGKEVLLVAADTFRAAAVEQLCIWGERVGAAVIKQGPGADPSAVAFDGLTAAMARKVDVVLVDTAGRLHTKVNLMEELQKIRRVMGRKLPGAPHEVWLVLDATTGQNAISQARMFHEALGVTGIVLTKLDGTAKGGIVVGISRELGIPIRFIGIGEKIDDLREFDAADFVRAIFD